MGLFFRPRRPLLRLATGAATAGVDYRAGQRRAEQEAYNQQAAAAYEATPGPAATGDQALIERVYTEDVAGWSPVLDVTSRDDLAADLRGREAAFSDIDLTLDPIDAVGDKLIAEWRVAATHSGPLVLDDLELLPTTNRRPGPAAGRPGGGAPTGRR